MPNVLQFATVDRGEDKMRMMERNEVFAPLPEEREEGSNRKHETGSALSVKC